MIDIGVQRLESKAAGMGRHHHVVAAINPKQDLLRFAIRHSTTDGIGLLPAEHGPIVRCEGQRLRNLMAWYLHEMAEMADCISAVFYCAGACHVDRDEAIDARIGNHLERFRIAPELLGHRKN